jgi:hypothetical protein
MPDQSKLLHSGLSQAASLPRSLLACCRRLFSAWVLRTASASISRSSALVFGGSRVDFHWVVYWVIYRMWGWRGQN